MYCCLLLQIYLCYLWLLLCSRDTYESKYSMFLNTQSCASVIGAHRGGGGSSGLSRAERGGAIHGVSSNQISSWAADDLASWQPHGQRAVPVAVVGHTVSAHHRAALRIEVVPAAVLVVQLRFWVWIRPSADKTRVLEIWPPAGFSLKWVLTFLNYISAHGFFNWLEKHNKSCLDGFASFQLQVRVLFPWIQKSPKHNYFIENIAFDCHSHMCFSIRLMTFYL